LSSRSGLVASAAAGPVGGQRIVLVQLAVPSRNDPPQTAALGQGACAWPPKIAPLQCRPFGTRAPPAFVTPLSSQRAGRKATGAEQSASRHRAVERPQARAGERRSGKPTVSQHPATTKARTAQVRPALQSRTKLQPTGRTPIPDGGHKTRRRKARF
jgi:hypothetical protein